MSAPQASPIVIHQSPRQLPTFATDTVTLYPLNKPNGPQLVSLLVSGMGLIGLLISILIYSHASPGDSTLIVGFVAISGITMLGSIITFFVQRSNSQRDARELLRLYHISLKEKKEDLERLDTNECAMRDFMQPPFSAVSQVWQRQPTDEDFLCARIGLGGDAPHFTARLGDVVDRVALPPKDPKYAKANAEARALVDRHQTLQRAVPLAISLTQHPVIAICGATPQRTANNVARHIAAQIVANHSPLDAHLMVIGPESQIDAWNWLQGLVAFQKNRIPQFGFYLNGRDQLCAALLDTLTKRETALGDRSTLNTFGRGGGRPLTTPHLIVIIDAFSPQDQQRETQKRAEELSQTLGAAPQPNPTWRSPFAEPAIALALRMGRELGVTVISLHAHPSEAPAQTTLLIDTQQQRLSPIVPPHERVIEGIAFDTTPPPDSPPKPNDSPKPDPFQQLHMRLFNCLPESADALTLSHDVELLSLFEPPITDPTTNQTYNVQETWRQFAQRNQQTSTERASFPIPLGQKLGGKPIVLDLETDGPHGLLIGQTGSGKSELLQSMIMAMAVQYSPDQVNFVLVDYKGGLSLETCAQLPHTIAFLTNLAQASQSGRFLTFLEAEMLDRQRKDKLHQPFPRLFVVIDEFAELVTRRQENDQTDAVVENLLRVLRLGRQLKVHLLFAAQRPEGGVIQRLRGYVQYRICLRVNTDEDSRDVLGRTDAASLPADAPGRGYVLRGDRELTLFQGARVTTKFGTGALPPGTKAKQTDTILLERMRSAYPPVQQRRWPEALLTPTFQNPTPLVYTATTEQVARLKQIYPDATVTAWPTPVGATLPRMVVPVGYLDRPTQKLQQWLHVDLLGHQGPLYGGPLLIRGDAAAGKTTTLQTLLLYLLSVYSPEQLRVFVIDANNSLVDFADAATPAPHLRDWTAPTQINHLDATNLDALKAMRERFEREIAVEPARRPMLLLVADDFDDAMARLGPTADKNILEMFTAAIQNRQRNVYLACAAARPVATTAMSAVLNGMMTRIVLYMNGRDDQRNALGNRLPYGPTGPTPGRGFVQTRTNLDEAQIAAPVPGANDAERIENLQAAIRAIASQWE